VGHVGNRKALTISPLCADAYNLLAAEAATTAEVRDLYARGLEAGELALGPKGFKEYVRDRGFRDIGDLGSERLASLN
jgi:hypothetical protein